MVFIYVLKLKNKKYYIGKTTNPKIRLKSHFDTSGSKWTQKYTPLNIEEIIPNCEDFDEDKYTLKYMNLYGIDNVRGGSFCELNLTNETKKMITKMINSSTDKCKLCGQKGHFANDCNYKNNNSNCPNKSNPYHQCNDYCYKKYRKESEEESYVDDYDNFKSEFLKSCKKIDIKNTKILMGEDILKILNNSSSIDFGVLKLTNVYGLCQTINKCDLNYNSYIGNYRNGINYKLFINGLLYILENDIEICDMCDNEMKSCICRKYKKNNSSLCYRCGRKGHFSSNCYALKHVKGYYL